MMVALKRNPRFGNPEYQQNRKFFGSEKEARKFHSEMDDPENYQIRWRHINDDFIVEPKESLRASKKVTNPYEQGTFYVTTFCNKPHRIRDGKPIGHECYILDPNKLQAEIEGDFEEANADGGIVKQPRKIHRGLRENSGEPDSAKAESVYKMWHKKEPHNVAVLDTGCDGDDEMVCVGNAFDIVYRSGKWEKGKKTNDYVHTFDSKPKVWMLRHLVEGLRSNPGKKSVEQLLSKAKNADGQFAVAELARPLSLGLVDGTDEGTEVAIHGGSKVYGAIDKRTVIIVDPHWQLIVICGGKMTFDERGIVK